MFFLARFLDICFRVLFFRGMYLFTFLLTVSLFFSNKKMLLSQSAATIIIVYSPFVMAFNMSLVFIQKQNEHVRKKKNNLKQQQKNKSNFFYCFSSKTYTQTHTQTSTHTLNKFDLFSIVGGVFIFVGLPLQDARIEHSIFTFRTKCPTVMSDIYVCRIITCPMNWRSKNLSFKVLFRYSAAPLTTFIHYFLLIVFCLHDIQCCWIFLIGRYSNSLFSIYSALTWSLIELNKLLERFAELKINAPYSIWNLSENKSETVTRNLSIDICARFHINV